MDFSLNESEQALADLVETIIGDKVDHAALRALETAGTRVDTDTWTALADAGVMAALLPEADGGGGLGTVALGGVLEIAARHAAALPLMPTMTAAQTIAACGSDAVRSAVLPKVSDGSAVLAPVLAAGVSAAAADGGVVLDGAVTFVNAGLDADVFVVRASGPDGDLLAVVPADAAGVAREAQAVTTGYDDANVTFSTVSVAEDHLLGESDHRAGAVEYLQQRVDAAICAMTAGLCQASVALASEYTNQRQQFDRIIASFQAVSQRVADAYIDLQGIELTSRQAAWRLDAGRDAGREIAIARWWAADASNRIVHAAVHVHGGVGVDRDYPLHRHFLLARKLELSLGNAEQQLAHLGRAIAHA